MSSRTAARTGATKPTMEQRVARWFGLTGDKWMRHANAWSVWTRFAVLPLIVVAVWSRDWIGWWSLIPIGLSLVWMMTNPLFFKAPKSTRNWASKGVFGERVYAERNRVELPAQFLTQVPNVANALSAVGLVVLAYGLIMFDLPTTIAGILVTSVAKAWYIDRMVLLFEDVKHRNPEYASWEY